jgi:hypothetical protein
MTKLVGVIVLGLALTACPKKTPSTPGGGPDTPVAAGKSMAGTMAEAPHQAFPSTLTVKPDCNQASYLILDVAEGKEFTIAVRPADGCVHVSVMMENGSTNDMPNAEICADAPKPPIAAKGQAGKTFISMNEAGACKGISVTVDFN